MISRTVVILALCAIAVESFPSNPMKDAAPEAPNTKEQGSVKISLEKLRFIPPELLCTLCHRVVEKMRHDLLSDPIRFQRNMLASCAGYPDPDDQMKCHEAFNNRKKISQLLQPNAATVMCREKLLCKPGELPMPPPPPMAFPMAGPRPLPSNMRQIPPVVQQQQQPQQQQQRPWKHVPRPVAPAPADQADDGDDEAEP